jgi:hypothetical protein
LRFLKDMKVYLFGLMEQNGLLYKLKPINYGN